MGQGLQHQATWPPNVALEISAPSGDMSSEISSNRGVDRYLSPVFGRMRWITDPGAAACATDCNGKGQSATDACQGAFLARQLYRPGDATGAGNRDRLIVMDVFDGVLKDLRKSTRGPL